MQRYFRKFIKIVGIVAGVLLVLALILLAPIDRTPLRDQAFYQQAKVALDTFHSKKIEATASTRVGWASVNITPEYSMPLAGYRPRDHFETVHDSIYGRVLVIDNGASTVALLSVDLMLFPKSIRNRLATLLDSTEFDFLYAGATHTHSSVGGWEENLVGQQVTGQFDSLWVNTTARQLYKAMQKAKASMLPATLRYGIANGNDLIENRLEEDGPTEGAIRTLLVERSDNSKAIFFTYNAHANIINKKSLSLSGDYPARVVSMLENTTCDFAMYMAGMVASHRVDYVRGSKKNFELIEGYAQELCLRIEKATLSQPVDSMTLEMAVFSIPFGDPQFRISKDWRVSPWLFNALVDPLEGSVNFLRLGDISFVGMPCDFSGELYLRYFNQENKPLVVTSFNGDYIGYITLDDRYDVSGNAEVRNLNWVGPYYGEYFSEMILKIIHHE